MFTFHDMIVPVLRRMAGLPPRSDAKVSAKIPVRIASELGRTEFVMVSLVEGTDGLIAYPTGKGSGAITSFAQADGFLRIDALADQMPAGAEAEVTLFTPHVRVPDLVIVGSHCTGLDLVTAPLARAGLSVRSIAVGSLGGLAAAKRGECDFAPIHLFDDKTETYNTPYLSDGLELVPGWRRMQGIVFRKGDTRFEGLSAEAAVRAALADPACIMVNRNQGAGTRILIDRLLAGARPDGYWNQPRSHNAVAAAVAQHRADWGMTIAPVAHASDLGFIPFAEEHYDFALVTARKQRAAVQAFLDALASEEGRAALAKSRVSTGLKKIGRGGDGKTSVDCNHRRGHGRPRVGRSAAAGRHRRHRLRAGIAIRAARRRHPDRLQRHEGAARAGARREIAQPVVLSALLEQPGLEDRRSQIRHDLRRERRTEVRRALSAGASRRFACGAGERRPRRTRQAEPQAGRAGRDQRWRPAVLCQWRDR